MNVEVGSTTERPQYGDTLDEHRECEELIRALELKLDRHADHEASWIADVVEDLVVIERVLPPHFVREEQGVFQEIRMDFPRFAERVDRLQSEHAQIAGDLRATIEFGRKLRSPAHWQFRQFNARVQLFVATLRRHSSEEDEMIRSAFWDDEDCGPT